MQNQATTPSKLFRGTCLLFALSSVVFHLALVFSGLTPNLVSRPIHMALALPWALCLGTQPGFTRVSGYVLAIVGMAACLWVAVQHDALADQYGFLENNLQIGIAIILLLAVLEAARRAVGWPLPLVAVIALLYGLFGQSIPGEFGHSGTPLRSFLGTLTIAEGESGAV